MSSQRSRGGHWFRAHVLACTLAFASACAPRPLAVGTLDEPTPPAPAPPPVTVLDEEAQTGPKTEVFAADPERTLRPRPAKTAGPAGDVNLDFVDAGIRDVARTVLGDILKVSFAIDPQVQGRITLKTSDPLRKEDVIAALETALKVNGAVIVLADNVYNIVPAAEGLRRTDGFELAGSHQARLPGFGIEIVPLKFVAAEEVRKVLEPVSPANAVVTIDATRNFIVLAGTSQERAAMLDTIRLFDVDYMRGMSYALVYPDHVEARALGQELTRVFSSTRGPGAGLVRFVPLTRSNILLVVSPSGAMLKDVSRWVERLDAPPRGAGRRVYYYRLQNAKAEEVARALASVYGRSVDLGALAQPADDGSLDGFETGIDAPAPPPDRVASTSPIVPQVRAQLDEADGPAAKGLQIAIDQANNALIVRADGTEYAALERLLRQIDVTPDQVLIEVTIAEVSLNDELRYGVEWFFKNADQTYTLSKTGDVASYFPGFAFTYMVPDVDIALSALGEVTDVKIISSPKLFTLNNKTATLQVGDQVPIITQSATGVRDATDLTVVNSVQLRDTGILLRVTPRIGKSGAVFVDVRQEVSDAVRTETSGIDSPTIQQRKLATTVAVQDGDSIALGGLIRDSVDYGDSGIPYLKDVPVFGKLFGKTTVADDRTELLIFLRPRIIRNPAAAREMTDQLRRSLRGLEYMLRAGRAPRSDNGSPTP